MNSCVLDGGHRPRDRICGSEAYLSSIRSAYGSSSFVESALIGDGPGTAGSDADDCHLPLMTLNQPPATGTTLVQGQSYMRNTRVSPANARSHVYSAYANDFSHCFEGAQPQDSCHFWSANHGTYGQANPTAEFARPNSRIALMSRTASSFSGLSAQDLSAKFTAAGCGGGVRYVLNNCFSGGMHEVLFDANGRYIQNRCGASATTYYHPATATIDDPDRSKPVHLPNGQIAYPPRFKYNYTDALTSAVRRGYRFEAPNGQSSLDDAHFYALMHDDAIETPTLSSDYYLERHFGLHDAAHRQAGAEAVALSHGIIVDLNACNRNVFGDAFQDQTVQQLMAAARPALAQAATEGSAAPTAATPASGVSALNTVEQAQAEADLTRQRAQVLAYETFMCTRFWQQACGSLSAAQKTAFVRQKYETDFKQQRGRLAQQYRQAMSATPPDTARAQAVMAVLDPLLQESAYYQRYEKMLGRLGETARFFGQADPDNIREYLRLRQCENSRFVP